MPNKYNTENIINELKKEPTITGKLNYWLTFKNKYYDEPLKKIKNDNSVESFYKKKDLSKRFFDGSGGRIHLFMGNSSLMMPEIICLECFKKYENDPEFTFWLLEYEANILFEILKTVHNFDVRINTPIADDYINRELKTLNDFEANRGKLFAGYKFDYEKDYVSSEFDKEIELTRIKDDYYKSNILSPSNSIAAIEMYAKHIYLKKYLEDSLNKTNLIGFNCQLLPETISNIHFQMEKKEYIKADLKDFKAIFSGEPVINFTPIEWLITNNKGNANKTALFVFIKQMLGKATNDIMKNKAQEFFRNKKSKKIIIKTYPNPDEQHAINYFTDIAGLLKLPDQNK